MENVRKFTPDEEAALCELSNSLDGFAELQSKHPDLVELFRCPQLVDRLLAAIELGEVGLDLNEWFARVPWKGVEREQSPWLKLSTLPHAEDCGTTACIRGHIALLVGARFDHIVNAPRPESGTRATKYCHYLGQQWFVHRLAFIVWRATYPEANLKEFDMGTISAGHIVHRYRDVDYSLELTVPKIRAFLFTAAGQHEPEEIEALAEALSDS